MTQSTITAEIDFEMQGKSTGYLRLPHSVHRSAYGWIPLPVVSIRNGDGPTVLFLSGVHGDEYEGQIALTKLARELSPTDIRGRVIILTMANAPAAEEGCRTSPIDNGNLNRLFPGNAQGAPTEMIAFYIEHVLMPMADYLVDLHSGGSSLFYPPTVLSGLGHTKEEADKIELLKSAFDLPYSWVFTSGGGPTSTARTALGGRIEMV